MKKILLIILFLQYFLSLSAQKALLFSPKNNLTFQKNLPSIGFKPMLVLKYKESISQEFLPTFNQKFRFEKTKIDSNSLSLQRVQNLYYRMKMWYAFQTKNRNSSIFRNKDSILARNEEKLNLESALFF